MNKLILRHKSAAKLILIALTFKNNPNYRIGTLMRPGIITNVKNEGWQISIEHLSAARDLK